MMRLFKNPLVPLGTLVALLVAGFGLVFLNLPQCPASYTQDQVNSANCIIGANIGLGLVFMLAAGIWLATIAAAVVLNRFKTNRS